MPESPILVTGGTGFTGGHLCRRLLAQGRPVRALVRDVDAAAGLADAGAELALGDLRDEPSLERAVDGVGLVYHIAAAFRQESLTRQQMWDINVEGTRRLLAAATEAGVDRFVHCSTIGVHGDVENPPASETAPYRPGDEYQESKTAAEKLVIEAMEQGRVPICVFRPGGMYGPGDTRFLKLFRAVNRGRFAMIGDGSPFYHLTYIDDLIDGILLCGSHPEAPGEVFILAGPEYVTLRQLVDKIAAALEVPRPRWRVPFWPVYVASIGCELLCKPLGIEPPLYRRRVDFFRKSRAFDIAKARSVLDFEPRVDLDEGLRRTADWYAREGLL